MGNICGPTLTAEEKKALLRNQEIGRANAQDFDRGARIIKILLLGTGESGKSTIFKQAKELFGNKFTKEQMRELVSSVYENINTQLAAMVYARRSLGIKLEDETLAEPFNSHNFSPFQMVDKEWAEHLQKLWQDPGMQKVWEKRSSFQVFDCIEYFMRPEVLSRIAAGGKTYLPSFDDVIHVRVKTTGVTRERFKINKSPFEMYDVGGQRSERRKWLQLFDNVTSVIFVAAINEYDQELYEAKSVERSEEAFKVWSDLVNRSGFQKVGFVLFLNKWDLFQKKVLEFPFKVPGGRNNDYTGADPMEAKTDKEREEATKECAFFIKDKFIKALPSVDNQTRSVRVHLTVATDTQNMNLVFLAAEEQILRLNLGNTGFDMGAPSI